MEIEEKLQEYISLLDFNDDYFKKDFKNNLKFVKYSIKKMIKNKTPKDEMIKFLQDTIDIHKRIYI